MRDLVAVRSLAPSWARLSHAIFFIILVIATTFAFPLADLAPDVFHEGEYSMYGVVGGRVGSGRPPVLAHGGIDVIPAQIAAAVCSPDRQIVCVRAVNGVFTGVCEALFLIILVSITGLGTTRALVASLPAIATLTAYNGLARSAFVQQMGTPNLRELFVLLILACLFWLYRDDGRMSRWGRYALTAAIGFLAGAGLFWIYNRGLFGFLLAAVMVGALSWFWRDWRPLACAAAGAIVGFGAAHLSGLYGDTASNFANILYWINHDEIYRIPSDISFFKESAPIVPLYLVLYAGACFVIWREMRAGRPQSAFPLLTLLLVLVFYAYQAYERTFTSYIAHTLWGLSLLSATLFLWATRPSARGPGMAVMTAASVAVSGLCVVWHLQYLPPNPKVWARNMMANARVLMGNGPRDLELVTPGLIQAADIIRARSPNCTYSFSNEGLIYLLAHTPPCSRFAYPLYISADSQTGVIREFEQTRPPIILWRSQSWANVIYGRDLVARTPDLAAWIPAHYPHSKVLADGVELRALEPFSDGK